MEKNKGFYKEEYKGTIIIVQKVPSFFIEHSPMAPSTPHWLYFVVSGKNPTSVTNVRYSWNSSRSSSICSARNHVDMISSLDDRKLDNFSIFHDKKSDEFRIGQDCKYNRNEQMPTFTIAHPIHKEYLLSISKPWTS